jgi:hypothetical protein
MKPLHVIPMALAFAFSIADATVPNLINYQGKLTGDDGQPANGSASVKIRVFDSETGGRLTYSEDIGAVTVTNGIYSFRFGASGSSVRFFTETIATTDGVTQIFNHVTANKPIAPGSVGVTDGANTWSESASTGTITGNLNLGTGAVTAIYLTGPPLAGSTLSVTYGYQDSGIVGALVDNNQSWLEVEIDAKTFSPRKQLVAMPFALVAGEALSVSGKIPESQLTLNDSSEDLLSLIASLQGQISQVHGQLNAGQVSAEKIRNTSQWFFSETFSDSNGDSDSVQTADTTATYATSLKSYVAGQLISANSSILQKSNVFGNQGYTSLGSLVMNQYVHFHTSMIGVPGHPAEGRNDLHKINYLYSDSTSAFSLEHKLDMRTYTNGGIVYFSNPFPEKFVAGIEPWVKAGDNGVTCWSKNNNSYGPPGQNELVSLKILLPTRSKTVTATRVDVLGQVLSSSTLNYELSDGNSTDTGLSLSTKNIYGLSQKPTSLTLKFNCPSISTVTVRFWFSE